MGAVMAALALAMIGKNQAEEDTMEQRDHTPKTCLPLSSAPAPAVECLLPEVSVVARPWDIYGLLQTSSCNYGQLCLRSSLS